VTCSYASIAPADPASPMLWQLTAIADVTAAVNGTLAWRGISGPVTASVDRLRVLAMATLDFTELASTKKVKVTITGLACSLAGLSLSNVLGDLIQVISPETYGLLTNTYALAGTINTLNNAWAIGRLNELLAKVTGSQVMAGAFGWLGHA
jgi:hypothetical protein